MLRQQRHGRTLALCNHEWKQCRFQKQQQQYDLQQQQRTYPKPELDLPQCKVVSMPSNVHQICQYVFVSLLYDSFCFVIVFLSSIFFLFVFFSFCLSQFCIQQLCALLMCQGHDSDTQIAVVVNGFRSKVKHHFLKKRCLTSVSIKPFICFTSRKKKKKTHQAIKHTVDSLSCLLFN